MNNSRRFLVLALVGNAVLLTVLATIWWRDRRQPRAADGLRAANTEMPSTTGPDKSGAPPTNDTGAGGSALNAVAGVEPNTPLAPVQLSPQRLQSIGVSFAVVTRHAVDDELRVTGNVEVNEERLSYVQTRFPGWIQKVYADAVYQHVRRGQPLFTIYSPQLANTEQEYLIARQNRVAVAASSVPGVAAGANELQQAAAARLRQWQVPPSEIARLEATGTVEQAVTVTAPADGFITERNALPNLYVQPETRLYTLADLSIVWVYAAVPQDSVGRVRVGDRATLTVDAYPGRNFLARVTAILPQVDAATRTARVRLAVPNPGLKFSPGMFVNVQLHLPLGDQLAIPASAVLQTGLRQIVFVDHGGGALEPRPVQLGAQVGDQYVVLQGLKGGERIATSANFLIDSESQLQAAMGSFLPPPPGAGQGAEMNGTSAPAAAIEFSTDPTPAHRGGNTFRVKLTTANGAPVTGAQVTANVFMAAMPAMGMAAMHSAIVLQEKGGGLYEGRGDLATGGTWQVTVVAQRNGQTLASKQLSLDVAGGM